MEQDSQQDSHAILPGRYRYEIHLFPVDFIEARRLVIEFIVAHSELVRHAPNFQELEAKFLSYLEGKIPGGKGSNQFLYGRNVLFQIYSGTDDFALKAVTLFKKARPSVFSKLACENSVLGEAF